MKKLAILIAVISSLIVLNGCASSNIEIRNTSESKTENLEQDTHINNENDKIPDPPKDTRLGDRFLAKNLILDGSSGEIYMTVNDAKVFENLSDAGVTFDKTFELYDGFNYDSNTGDFLGNRVLVMVKFTIENINATSREYAGEPEKYDKYDFRVDNFGGCTGGQIAYSSKSGEVTVHPLAFHIEPNETKEIKCGYLVNLDDVSIKDICFELAATKKNDAIIDLKLGD